MQMNDWDVFKLVKYFTSMKLFKSTPIVYLINTSQCINYVMKYASNLSIMSLNNRGMGRIPRLRSLSVILEGM